MKPNKEFAIKTARKYRGQELKYGTVDCNLVILETIDPEIYKTMYGRYKTILGGARQAKKLTGFKTLPEYIRAREDFVEVSPDFATIGDIGFQKFTGEVPATIIHLGDSIFGINEDGVFSILPLNNSVYGFQFYRRTSCHQ